MIDTVDISRSALIDVMAQNDGLMLAVWQDVSRHLEISESTETLATLLGESLPLHSLIVCRLDAHHRTLHSAAYWPAEMPSAVATNGELPLSDWRRLERWHKLGAALHAAAERKTAIDLAESIRLTIPPSDWVIAPLTGEHGSRGLLLVV